MKQIELNAMNIVADELIANMDGYERIKLAKDLYNIINKSPQKALDVLLGAIVDAKDDCIEHNICPECGKRLEFVKTGYDADINATYGYKKCSQCGLIIEE